MSNTNGSEEGKNSDKFSKFSNVYGFWPILLAWSLILLAISWGAMCYGNPQLREAASAALDSKFSCQQALTVFSRIFDDKPHPMGSPENQLVLERLQQEFHILQYQTEIQENFVLTGYGTCGTVKNIMARKGKPGNSAILLLTHYDSVPAGPGASDAGVAVACLLEIARIASQNGDQDIIFLCTDGEEAGMMGAQAFTRHPWFKDVRFAVNLEARGTSGAAIVFEFIGKTGDFVKDFAAHAPRPVSNSLAQTVYDLLPNDTDLSVFRNHDIPGVNIAFIGSVTRYHTPLDSKEFLTPASMQHMGESALAAIEAAQQELQNGSIQRQLEPVFFDVFGYFLVSWPRGYSPWFMTFALVILIIISGLLWYQGLFKLSQMAWSFLAWWGTLLISLGGVALVATLLSSLGKVPPLLPFPASPTPVLVLECVISVVITMFISVLSLNRGNVSIHCLATWISWSLLALFVSIFLEGASYLLVLPAVTAAFSSVLLLWHKNRVMISVAVFLPVIMLSITTMPPIWVFVEALGLGTIPAASLLFALAGTMLVPVYIVAISFLDTRYHRRVLYAPLVVTLLSLIVVLINPTYDRENPLHLNLTYHEHHAPGAIDANYIATTFGETLPDSLKNLGEFSKEITPVLPHSHPWTDGYSMPTKPQNLAYPTAEVIYQKNKTEHRSVKILAKSQRGAREIHLGFREHHRIQNLEVHGVRSRAVAYSERWSFVAIKNVPPEGIEIFFKIEGNSPMECILSDYSFGLPEAGKLLKDHLENCTPVQDGDVVVVSKSLEF